MQQKTKDKIVAVEALLDRHVVVSAAGVAQALGLARYQARDLLYLMQTNGLIVSAPVAPGTFTRPAPSPKARRRYTQED
jgi:predicted ArsR family transcriptional regulator